MSRKIINHDLVVFDDIFPHLLSPFRITEFNAILDRFDNCAIYSSGNKFRVFGKKRDFSDVYREYKRSFPEHAPHVFRYHPSRKISSKLCYLMFLNNASYFLDYLSSHNIPFVLELYPGGGFRLEEKESDAKLRMVTSSPLLRKVITTQKVTYDYLINGKFCSPDQVEFVFGGVFPAEQLTGNVRKKRCYRFDKDQLDICFVAHKYMEQGKDKGYDVFVEVAHLLADLVPEARFHVVGPFGAEDVDVTRIKDRLTFYGSRTTDFFPDFYAEMDLILSPNAPHILSPGAFDGFPTGACIEAGLCGTTVFACDELALSPFEDGEGLVIVPRDPIGIAGIVMKYRDNPEHLHKVGLNGQKRFSEVFSVENQMAPRIKILETLLNQGRGQDK